ncbi:MAG TPA: hypothetical protein VGS21_12280 [Acidimicrobiales bacterium]|nr:hypothetical protein [Acidimicrobiales bacterium]
MISSKRGIAASFLMAAVVAGATSAASASVPGPASRAGSGVVAAARISPRATGGSNSSGYLWSGASCLSASQCEIAGTYTNGPTSDLAVRSFANGGWTLSVPTGQPGDLQVNGFACGAVGSCIAVGGTTTTPVEPFIATWSAGTWAYHVLTVTGGASLDAVSCATAGWCLAAGATGSGDVFTETFADNIWTKGTTALATPDTPDSVSCPVSGYCVLSTPSVIQVLSAGHWAIQSGWQSAIPGTVYSVSCAAATFCMAVGDSITKSSVAVLINGTWSAEAVPKAPGLDPETSLEDVTCLAPEVCMATGSFQQGTAGYEAIWEYEVGGNWVVKTGPTVNFPGFSHTDVPGNACAGMTLCVTFGTGQTGATPYTWYQAYSDWFQEGFWTADASGAVFHAGTAPAEGSLNTNAATNPVVGIAPTPDGKGYWEVTRNGTVAGYGDAKSYGDLPGQHITVNNIVAIAPTADGHGYWLIGADGGEFTYGDARFHGSLPGIGIRVKDIVGMVATPNGGGYLIVGADGGVFTFGFTKFYGSLPGIGIKVHDIVSILPSPAGTGYALVGADGGVFNFGTGARFYGSLPGEGITVHDIVGLALTPDAHGYWLAGADGHTYAFGDAENVAPKVSLTPVTSIADAA